MVSRIQTQTNLYCHTDILPKKKMGTGRGGDRGGLLSAKGGLMMGTKKGGSSLQPAEREPLSLYQKKVDCKGKF